jgi:hypothetical protein
MPDLIDRVRAKQAIPDVPSADDTLIDVLVTAASDAIHEYCRRIFPLASYDEITVGRRKRLALKQFPIVSVARIAVADRPALLLSNTNSLSNQRATARPTSTGIVLTRVASGVTTTDSSILWSGNATLQAVANAVNALGNGWQATVSDGYVLLASADLRPTDVANPCIPSAAEFFVHNLEKPADRIDADAGFVYGCFPEGCGNVRVEYSAGYSTVPEAIQQACATLVAQWYAESKHDAARRIDRLGDAEYTRFSPEGLPEPVRRLLAPWRNLMG